MICKQSLEEIVKSYVINVDDNMVKYITRMIAARLEIVAYDMIRQSDMIKKQGK